MATDRDATVVKVAGSHGMVVLETYFPYYDRPVTADGYAAYKIFTILQRCWSHILREFERYVRTVKKRAGMSQTDCRDAEMLH